MLLCYDVVDADVVGIMVPMLVDDDDGVYATVVGVGVDDGGSINVVCRIGVEVVVDCVCCC